MDESPIERPEKGMFYGFPEAWTGVVDRMANKLGIAIGADEPFAGLIVGQQKVGKTTAVRTIEQRLREQQGLVASYEATPATDSRLIYVKADIGADGIVQYRNQFWSEVPIDDRQTLQSIADSVQHRGTRVVVDVVNTHFPLGDPRNNTEATEILRRVFQNPYIENLFAKPKGVPISTRVVVSDEMNHLELDLAQPDTARAFAEHKRRVEIMMQRDFIPTDTYDNGEGQIVTNFIFAGNPDTAFGSTLDQSVVTELSQYRRGKR
ncbi:MAG: hypothetical protein WC775_02320 [Patescibacteria group bacterium]|jgi:hypothetical protein